MGGLISADPTYKSGFDSTALHQQIIHFHYFTFVLSKVNKTAFPAQGNFRTQKQRLLILKLLHALRNRGLLSRHGRTGPLRLLIASSISLL